MSPPRRPARGLPAAVLCALPAAAQDTVSYPPNAPEIVYSDYACAHVGPERASFDRQLEDVWVCYHEEMSPGVRATFLVDASEMRFRLGYRYAGFLCGREQLLPLAWEFGLVVDGVRQPTAERNPLYPLAGGYTPWVSLGGDPGPHRVTLVWPVAADVDLLGVELGGTSRFSPAPNLLQPPPRDEPVLTIFGDSIVHGLAASHVLNTYTVRIGAEKGWRIVNLGYAGRNTQPSDAWLAAGFGACADGVTTAPDLLLLSIGSNDFHALKGIHTRLERFDERYRAWLAQFRLLRPATPVLCLTPLPRGDECAITTRKLEDYRERIRAIVLASDDPDLYLLEGRDLVAFPPLPGDPLFDAWLLHPNDAGSEQIAERLGSFDLARNGDFALRALAGCVEVAEPEPYLWTAAGTGASYVADRQGHPRALVLESGAAREQLVAGLSAGERFTLRASGIVTTSNPGRIRLHFLDAAGADVATPAVLDYTQTSWRRLSRSATVPPGTIRGRLELSLGGTRGLFAVDDVELTLQEF